MSIKNYAEEQYRISSGGDKLVKLPRVKYNYSLVIYSLTNKSSVEFLTARDVTLPGYHFDTEVVNQYNYRRIVQKSINYQPIQISFYDTYDNEFHKMMTDYIAHYYHQNQGLDYFIDASNSTVSNNFQTRIGLFPVENLDKYFFPEIMIVQSGIVNEKRTTRLVNCMITTLGGSDLAYSSSDPVVWNVTFQPELVFAENVPSTNPGGISTL